MKRNILLILSLLSLFFGVVLGGLALPLSETTAYSALPSVLLSGGGGGGANINSDDDEMDAGARANSLLPLPEGGGDATTSGGVSVDGSALGSSTPIMNAQVQSQPERDNDSEFVPQTPVDPNAPVIAAPDVAPTSPKPAPVLQGNSAPSAVDISPSAFVFERNSDLGAVTTSPIGEVSHASNGPIVLMTYNWGAARSNNLGQTWTFYNPATFFPAPPATVAGAFCCDQIAYYDQNHDTMFWVLQYGNNITGNNAIRIAWAKGQNDLANMHWCFTDFTPQQLGSTYGPNGTNYDQPKFARSDNDVYLDIQRYGTVGGATIIRIANSEFTTYPSCGGVNYQFYIPDNTVIYSPGFAQRTNSVMYFAAHVSTSKLRIFSWPESVSFSGITSNDVNHTAYFANYPNRCPRNGGSATSDWCQRRSFGSGWAHSDRIFTGWLANGVLTFMWDSTQTWPGSTSAGSWFSMTYPFVAVARITETTMALASQPIIYSPSTAWVYATASKNDRGDAAGTLMWGGGTYFENCATWIWDGYSPDPAVSGWEVYYPRYSNSDPSDTLSGDYFASRRNGFNGNTWSGSCYTIVGSSTSVHAYYLWFGRFRDFHDVLMPFIRR